MSFVVIRARRVVLYIALLVLIPIIFSFFTKTVQVFNVNGREIPIYCVDRDDKKIALTFDCAWNDEDIDIILDTLDEYNCRATFFVVGDWVEKYNESLVKIHNRGHEIGNHSYNHKDYTKLSAEEISHDLEICDNVIENTIGVKPSLVRAPSGGYNNTVIKTCEDRGNTYIQWSVDSIDYGETTVSAIVERATRNVKAGDIILLHNGTEHTAEALPQILEKLSHQFEFATVSNIIYKNNYKIDHAGMQIKIK